MLDFFKHIKNQKINTKAIFFIQEILMYGRLLCGNNHKLRDDFANMRYTIYVNITNIGIEFIIDNNTNKTKNFICIEDNNYVSKLNSITENNPILVNLCNRKKTMNQNKVTLKLNEKHKHYILDDFWDIFMDLKHIRHYAYNNRFLRRFNDLFEQMNIESPLKGMLGFFYYL